MRTETSSPGQKTGSLQQHRVKVLSIHGGPSLSDNELLALEAVINFESAAFISAVEQFAAWEGDVRAVTKYVIPFDACRSRL